MNQTLRWWQSGVIYQLLVPSFLDTDGDGMGDLQGVIERLEYLEWLGVDAVWLTPIYSSSLVDMGYGISDFKDVDPQFGSLSQFDELVAEAHRRNLKIIMDWVPNHTSVEHPWFQQSRSSRDNDFRDWYFWRDPQPDGAPPNNWLSVFGGKAWQWDEQTGQFYMHTFSVKQPDLNWRSPDVQAAMIDTLRFWLDRGVDGFRVDAVDRIMKDEQLRDNPPNPDYDESQLPVDQQLAKYSTGQPGIHQMLARIRSVVDQYEERILLGELYAPTEELIRYYGKDQPELHLPLNLRLIDADWNAETLREKIADYEPLVSAGHWPNWVLSSHDFPRLAARLEGDQTRLAALLLFTLPGTLIHYYGEEIGMRGVPIPPSQAVDPQGRGTGHNRDPERTPMQWNDDLHAGFSAVEPWLPIADDFHTANVRAQSEQPTSLLTLYRRLIDLRRQQTCLVSGKLALVESEKPWLAYRRRGEGHLLVLFNLSEENSTWELRDPAAGRLLLSTNLDREEQHLEGQVELRGNEGLIISLE